MLFAVQPLNFRHALLKTWKLIPQSILIEFNQGKKFCLKLKHWSRFTRIELVLYTSKSFEPGSSSPSPCLLQLNSSNRTKDCCCLFIFSKRPFTERCHVGGFVFRCSLKAKLKKPSLQSYVGRLIFIKQLTARTKLRRLIMH